MADKPYYKNNRNLKVDGVVIDYTPEQVEEYIRCKEDIFYFAENFVYINTLNKGRQIIKLYDYQKEFLRLIENNRFVIAKIPRQQGKTVSVEIAALHQIVFNADQTIGIFANKASVAFKILKQIKDSYEKLPWHIQPGILSWNVGSIELSNKSMIVANSTTADSGRSYSYNCIIGNSNITVRNKQTRKIETISIDELKERLGK